MPFKSNGIVINFFLFLSLTFIIDAAVPADAGETPLVFIPGIKGSMLVDTDKKVRWLTLFESLGFFTPQLSLPIVWSGDQQGQDSLHCESPLESVGDILLLKKDIYGGALRQWRESGRQLYSFCYDWRRDNLETALLFQKFLEKIKSSHGDRPAQVVAHSMGGLIAMQFY